MYVPAEWADTLTMFHLYQYMYSVLQSMNDAVYPSRMMIIRIVLYKDRFDVYVRNARDFTIKIVLNRKDHRLHASRRTW